MRVDWRELPGRYVKDPRLGHRLGRNYPAGELSDAEWNIRWLGTDSEGFVYNRTVERDFALGDDTYKRLFLYGGSTVMGLGVERNDETICTGLEREWQATAPSARTVNCGCGAYVSWQQMLHLTLEMARHRPDYVVTLDGWNDFVHSSWGNKNYGGNWIPNTHRSLDDVVALMQAAGSQISLREFLGQKLARMPILREFEARQRAAVRPGIANDPEWKLWSLKPLSIDCYISNLRSIIGSTRLHGGKAVCLLQPQLLWGNRVRTEAEEEFVQRVSKRVPPIAELALPWFSKAQAEFSALRNELHDGRTIWIEDASEWLTDLPETVYHDYNHYNARGQSIIAKRIAAIVRAMDLRDSEKPRDNGEARGVAS